MKTKTNGPNRKVYFGRFKVVIKSRKLTIREIVVRGVSRFFAHPFVKLSGTFLFGTVIVGIFSALRDGRAQEIREHAAEVRSSLESINKITDSLYLYLERADMSYASLKNPNVKVDQLRPEKATLDEAYVSLAAAGSRDGAEIEAIFPNPNKVSINNGWILNKQSYPISFRGAVDFTRDEVKKVIIWWGWSDGATGISGGVADADSTVTERAKTLLTLAYYSHRCLDSLYESRRTLNLNSPNADCGMLVATMDAGDKDKIAADHGHDPTDQFDGRLNRIDNCGDFLFDFMRRVVYRDDIRIFNRSNEVDKLFNADAAGVRDFCDIPDVVLKH